MILTEASKAELVKKSSAIIAERIRRERVEFFKRIIFAEKDLRAMLNLFTTKITSAVVDKAHATKNAKRISEIIHDQAVALRMSLRVWINAAVRDSAKMGFRHIGDALLPVFKHNRRKTMEQAILVERALFESSLDLLEANGQGKLLFGLDPTFAGTTAAGVVLSSKKWQNATAQIIRNITKKNLHGLNPSDRVWELTTRAEQDLKRMVVNGMANGENPAVIARKIRKYVSPDVQDASALGIEPGIGVYRSPYKNAMRLARTEMNRTYVKAQVAFAKDKPWVEGMDITLSPAHDTADECDDLADGGPYTPDEVDELIPAHPHCMCRGTPRIDPQYLGDGEEPTPDDSEEE